MFLAIINSVNFIYQKQKMPEQTNTTWWNPFNLIDNPQATAPVQPAAPAPVQNTAAPAAQPQTAAEEKWPSGFTRKLIWFIAKLAGQPDPETWAPNTQAQPQAPQATAPQNQTVPNNTASFDNIMSWVTGFLDKVENKIENVTGINLDAPIQNTQTPAQQAAPVQQPAAEQPAQPAQPQNPTQQ